MKILHGKVNVQVTFVNAKVTKKGIICPVCSANVVVTDEDIINADHELFLSIALVGEWNEIVQRYNKNKFSDFIDYRVEMARWQKQFNTFGQELIINGEISVELPCGHRISARIDSDAKMLEKPNQTEALLKLGLETEKAHRWLSYIFTAKVNVKVGERKAQELMDTIKAWEKEKAAIVSVREEIRKLLAGKTFITGFDMNLNVDFTAKKAIKEIEDAEKGLFNDIDTPLQRVAFYPEIRKEIERPPYIAKT